MISLALVPVWIRGPIDKSIHRVSKKRPTFDLLYSLYIHDSIATIFGTNVAEKVGNQNVFYLPTSPN